MRLLICAGGTGGGVYPALTVWTALNRAEPDLETLWVGGAGGMEAELVQRAGLPYESIPAAGVHGVGVKNLPGNLTRLSRGYFQAGQIVRRFQPDVLFFTGGYVAPPVALAARTLMRKRIPIVLYVPDIEPGLALKSLARFANQIAVTSAASKAYFPGRQAERVVITGYPVRPELKRWERQEALQALGLAEEIPTLLVFGGSLGARSINRALLAVLPMLLPDFQVVHVTGALDWEEVQAAGRSLAPDLLTRYRTFQYLHEEMGAAFTVADLVVSRSGAAPMGEFPMFGLPAILVPYPHAWRYQRVNAEHLSANGAAILLADAELPEKLGDTVRELLSNPDRLAKMQAAMRSLARPGAAEAIASLLRRQALGRERI